MAHLSTDAIVTIIGAVFAGLVSLLNAYFSWKKQGKIDASVAQAADHAEDAKVHRDDAVSAAGLARDAAVVARESQKP